MPVKNIQAFIHKNFFQQSCCEGYSTCMLCQNDYKQPVDHFEFTHCNIYIALLNYDESFIPYFMNAVRPLKKEKKEQKPQQMKPNSPKKQQQKQNEEEKIKNVVDYARHSIAVLSSIHDISFRSCSAFSELLFNITERMKKEGLPRVDIIEKISKGISCDIQNGTSERVRQIGDVLKNKTFELLNNSTAIAFQMDESTDVCGNSKSCVHARVMNTEENGMAKVCDKFVGLKTNKGNTVDAHSLLENLFEMFCSEKNALTVTSSGTTDNGPNVLKMKGLLKQFLLERGKVFISSTCFLHDLNIVASAVDDMKVMDVVNLVIQYMTGSFQRLVRFRERLGDDVKFWGLLKYAITR